MKAIGIKQYGSKGVLLKLDVPTPKIKADQVLIKSFATSVNLIDWKIRAGNLQDSPQHNWPFPIVLGFDTARSIVEVGENVTNWQVTDHVFARKQTSPQGSYAEFVAVDDHLLAKIPEILTFEEAGATPLAGLTAWQALFDKGHLQPDETVLIHGGSGGVGTFAIQLAKYHGAKVITTTSSKNVQLLKKSVQIKLLITSNVIFQSTSITSTSLLTLLAVKF